MKIFVIDGLLLATEEIVNGRNRGNPNLSELWISLLKRLANLAKIGLVVNLANIYGKVSRGGLDSPLDLLELLR